MAIVDQIVRLQEIKADISAAIESKDVSVPDEALYSDLAALIDAIPYLTGTIYTTYVKPASGSSTISAAWPYDKVPDLVLVSRGGRGLGNYDVCNVVYYGSLRFGFYEYPSGTNQWVIELIYGSASAYKPTLSSGMLKITESMRFESSSTYMVMGVYL